MKKLCLLFICFSLSLSGYSQSCLPEGITFATQEQIDSFQVNYPGCTEIEGDVIIQGNAITNITGLNVLTSINGSLEIYECEMLTSLTGLEDLTSIGGGLWITSSGSLTSLTGLDNLTIIGDFLGIDCNDNMTSLMGLEGLNSIGNALSINNMYSLINLSGLDNLTSIGGEIEINQNPVLTSLTGLLNLTSIGGRLLIEDNDYLTSLTGLANIDAGSITDLDIGGNASLSTCGVQSICDYLASPNGVVGIGGNASGCNNPPEIANSCGISLPCLPYGNYYFGTQADIDNFNTNYPDCADLEGNVEINGSEINNVDSLNNVISIGGNLYIGFYYYGGNPNLTSLAGFENLTSVAGNLEITHNSSLTNLTGLDNINSIGGDLWIYDNGALQSLTGLESLSYIDNWLSISGNHTLYTLSGIDNIYASSVSNLQIVDNDSLSTCEVLSVCDYIASPNGTIEIHDNAPGCNTREEVEAACEVGFSDYITCEHQFTISPNPSSTQITIETTVSSSKFQISIFNLNGQEIMSHQIADNKAVIDISNLPGGVYFVRMMGKRSVSVEKFVKMD